MKRLFAAMVACLAILGRASSGSNCAEGEVYFPDGVFDADNESSDFTAEWYGDQLESMHQISL